MPPISICEKLSVLTVTVTVTAKVKAGDRTYRYLGVHFHAMMAAQQSRCGIDGFSATWYTLQCDSWRPMFALRQIEAV